MSEALRMVMAEFGFEVDLPTLEKLDKALKATVDQTKKATKATDEGAKAQSQATKAAAKAQDELSKKLCTYAGILDHLDDVFSEKLGKNIAGRFKSVDDLAKRFGITNKGIGKIVAAASAVAIAGLVGATRAAFAFADAFSANASALRDTARESRVTTTALQEIDHAASESGVGVERMRAGLATFGQGLRAGERWGNGTTGMLRRLGIQARDTNGRIRPTGDLLDETAVALERIENPYRRARVAQQLFGESGRRMLDVLHSGPGGIRALREELGELGGGVTPEAIEASRQYTAATRRLQVAQDSLRSVLATTLLPVLSWVIDKGAKLAGLFARLTRGTHVVEVVFAALGVVGAAVAAALIAAWLPVISPVLGAVAAAALLVGALDDVITFVEGGDSAIGRLIDSLFGVGTSAQYVHELREEWEAVQNAIAGAIAKLAEWTGLGEQQAQGTLRAPSFGPPPGRPGVRAPIVAGAAGARPSTVASHVVPGTHSVSAPGSVAGARTTVRQTTHSNTNNFHLAGPDARQLAGQVGQILERQAREQRDADHPQGEDA